MGQEKIKNKKSKSQDTTSKIVEVKENKDSNQHSSKPSSKSRKLYRSQNEKMIAGVCGGLSEYLDIDPIWVRLVFLLTAFVNGIGFIAYIILWILVPVNHKQKDNEKTMVEEKLSEFSDKIKKKELQNSTESSKGRYIGGMILIVIGGVLLFEELFWSIDWDFLFPILIIILGLYILFNKKRE